MLCSFFVFALRRKLWGSKGNENRSCMYRVPRLSCLWEQLWEMYCVRCFHPPGTESPCFPFSWTCPIVTTYMQQNLSWEANTPSVNKFPAFYPEFHYCIHRHPPPVLFLTQISPVQAPHPTFWRYILILSSHVRLSLQCGLFPSGLSTKTVRVPFLSPIRATCPAHLILIWSAK